MLQAVPNHPYAMYGVRRDDYGRVIISFACKQCGDQYQKVCQNSQRIPWHAYRYGVIHAHGLRPVHAQR